ncbi:40S ribosomal protein S8 [Hibiscus syriacus]|uniref:40S ribosomal protein S8 n=1 Tax=Hibiscus syriacus TaxID=106335 RepID=A0A6A3AX65_HIBSY|nr:40S ribosomal protein S8 [Hibiscus syriacus]
MGISMDSMHKRRSTGGKKKAWRKKRKYELGRQPGNTKLSSNKTVRRIRTREGNTGAAKLAIQKNGFALLRYSDASKVVSVLQRMEDVARLYFQKLFTFNASRADDRILGGINSCITPDINSELANIRLLVLLRLLELLSSYSFVSCAILKLYIASCSSLIHVHLAINDPFLTWYQSLKDPGVVYSSTVAPVFFFSSCSYCRLHRRDKAQSFRGSRITVAIVIGVLLCCLIAFFFPYGLINPTASVQNRRIRKSSFQIGSSLWESSEQSKMLKSEIVSLLEKNSELKKQVRNLKEKLQLAQQVKDNVQKQFLVLGEQHKTGPFGTVKALRTNPTVIPAGCQQTISRFQNQFHFTTEDIGIGTMLLTWISIHDEVSNSKKDYLPSNCRVRLHSAR